MLIMSQQFLKVSTLCTQAHMHEGSHWLTALSITLWSMSCQTYSKRCFSLSISSTHDCYFAKNI